MSRAPWYSRPGSALGMTAVLLVLMLLTGTQRAIPQVGSAEAADATRPEKIQIRQARPATVVPPAPANPPAAQEKVAARVSSRNTQTGQPRRPAEVRPPKTATGARTSATSPTSPNGSRSAQRSRSGGSRRGGGRGSEFVIGTLSTARHLLNRGGVVLAIQRDPRGRVSRVLDVTCHATGGRAPCPRVVKGKLARYLRRKGLLDRDGAALVSAYPDSGKLRRRIMQRGGVPQGARPWPISQTTLQVVIPPGEVAKWGGKAGKRYRVVWSSGYYVTKPVSRRGRRGPA